ncbi:MAG: hypothetical protein OEZ22_13140 [Spirochaetia bacterium]|nr:hypothetical protein [Spirochaetia bacterium]
MQEHLEIYGKCGIWGWMNEQARSIFAKNWIVWIFEENKLIPIYKSHEQKEAWGSSVKYDQKEWKDQLSITNIPSGYLLSMPGIVANQLMFYWQMEFSQVPNQAIAENIKRILDMLLAVEALDRETYPTFLPFFYPIEEELNINLAIQKNSSFVFINGQNGVGKKTFLQNFILYNYNIFIKRRIFESKDDIIYFENDTEKNIIIVPEAALLDKNQQAFIVESAEDIQNNLIVVISIYNIEMLLKHDIFIAEFSQLLKSHKLLIPSLAKRENSIKKSTEFWLKAKGCYFLSILNNLNDKNFSWEKEENFYGVQNNLLNNEKLNILQEDVSFLKNAKLRQVITDLEIKAIDYARKMVGDSQHKVAKFLGVSRGSLQHKLRKYKIYGIKWE